MGRNAMTRAFMMPRGKTLRKHPSFTGIDMAVFQPDAETHALHIPEGKSMWSPDSSRYCNHWRTNPFAHWREVEEAQRPKLTLKYAVF